jgi:predicted O-methyltransferase YrrM
MVITNKIDDLGEIWMAEEHFILFKEIISKYKENAALLEIGSYKGRSAIYFLQNNPHIELTCLDNWKHGGKKEFLTNIERYNVVNRIKIIEDDSTNVKKYFSNKSLDFIYLDGSHQESDVYRDLLLCSVLLKKNGVLIGDDWQKQSVLNAVKKTVSEGVYKLNWHKKYIFSLSTNIDLRPNDLCFL